MQITRNTGFVGMGSKIKVKIDNRDIILQNNESQQLPVQNKTVTVRARQAYFGSQEIQVEDTKEIEIKSNPLAIVMFFVSIVPIVFASLINPLICSVLGLVLLAITAIYANKNWFKLEVK